MFKRLIALLVVALGFLGSAHAQFSCGIENDFGGTFTGVAGDYTVNVSPGQNGTLRAAPCDTAVNSYNWSPGNLQTQSISVTAPTSGAITYTLTPCQSSTQQCGPQVRITLQVAVVPPPDCTLTASPNPATSGQTVTFTATCNPNTRPAVSINYFDLSGVTRTSSGLTFTDVAPAVTATTQRTVDYRGNAADGTAGPLHSLVVTINPAPVTTVLPPTGCRLTANPNPVTQGLTSLLTAACTGGDPVASYTFTDASNAIIQNTSANTVVVRPPLLGPNNYLVRASNAGGSSTASVQVVVVPPPPSGCTLTAAPSALTLGSASTLTAQCTGGGAPSTYRFTAPDGSLIIDQPGNTLTVTPSAVGTQTYGVTISNAGGNTTANASITVTAASCTITPSAPNPIQRGASVTLTAACNNNPVSYSWTTAGVAVPGGNGPSITVAPTTTTTYTVIANNGSTQFPVSATAQYTVVVSAATAIAAVTGPTITGRPGQALTRALQVRVSDAQGIPVTNEPVTWSVVNPGSSPGTFASNSTASNATGIATNTFTYGTDAGGRTLRACLASLPTVCADFTVVAGAATIASIVGSTLSGAPGRPLSSELQVRVADAAGTAVAGELVNWSVVNPGASPGTFAASQTGPTDAQGVTRNTFTLGNDTTSRTLRACLNSAPTVCVDFQVTVIAASGLVALAGSTLVGAPGRPLSRDLQVRATNALGAPVAGELVNWTVVSPGSSPGTFAANPSGPTNAQGIATNTFTMGNDPGRRTLRACLASQPSICVDFLVRSLNEAVDAPATKIISPLAELAVASSLTQLSNIRFRLDQLRARRNPAVIEALRVRVAGQSLPAWNAFAVAPVDSTGKPLAPVDSTGKPLAQGSASAKPQKGGGAAADDPFERIGVFVNGEVEVGKQSSTSNERGFDLRTTGITAGVDYRLPNDAVIGIAGGFMNAKTDLNDGGGSQGARGYSVSAYGSFVPTEGAYVDFIAHAGGNKYDTRRRELSDAGASLDYNGNTRGDQFAVAVTAGADFNRAGVTMNPYVRLDYVNAKINGFSESGAQPGDGAIRIDDLNLKTTIVTLGGQFSYAISTSWGVFMPNARLELQRRVQGSGRIVGAQLVADGTINSQVGLETVDRDYGNASIGFSVVLPRGVNGFVNYERLFGRSNYSNSKLTLGLRFEF